MIVTSIGRFGDVAAEEAEDLVLAGLGLDEEGRRSRSGR